MKALGIVLVVVGILGFVGSLVWGGVYLDYFYNVNVGQYVRLSDDASTADVKLQYLEKYVEQIKTNITRNEARYIFKQERFTRDKQLTIIETLIERLKQTSEMNPKSFEYQQAMSQISGQEYDHTLAEIDGVIQGCWFRQSPFAVWCLWFGWWVWVIVAAIVGGAMCSAYW